MKTASKLIDKRRANRKAKLPFRMQGIAKAEAENQRRARQAITVTSEFAAKFGISPDRVASINPTVPAIKSLDAAIKRRPSPGPTVRPKKVAK